jgi:glutaminyl-peptide cyclotransferase
MHKRIAWLILLIALLTTASVSASPMEQGGSGSVGIPPDLMVSYEVLGSYPHDRGAYLQGLVWYEGGFYESTGVYGESTLRRVAFPSGDVLQQTPLAREYFGEGLALVGDRLVQLTWRAQRGFVYERESFGLIGDFSYQTEGWGLTYDGTSLIMSDGSSTLTYLDPETFQPTRSLTVTLGGRDVRALNELEWIDGQIWSNVYQTNFIVRIDPQTGYVVGVLDMKDLVPAEFRGNRDEVLNGIAYDGATGRIFVGGKRWPALFEIRLT